MRLKFRRYFNAVLCALSTVILLLTGVMFTAFAETVTGTLTLYCRTEEITLSGMNWNIYRVGSRTGSGFVLDGDFSNYQVDLSDLTSDSGRKTAAKTLENYAVLDGILPTSFGRTDDNGVKKFEGLVPGLYLISGNELVIGNTTYVPSTLLIEISSTGQPVDIDAYPKIISRVEENPEEIDYSAKGFWRDENGEDIVDASPIKIEIYRNNELFDTVILDENNNWTHNWKGSPDDEWRIKEIDVPDNVTVIYDSNERQFVVVNTPKTEKPPVTTTTTVTTSDETTTTTTKAATTTKKKNDEKIPQTGQLWWPVPLLGLMGLILIAIGLRIRSMEKNESNENN